MSNKMRIIQLIDSLETGGAERMAVNYANALANKIEFSGLVATRKEGGLKKQLNSNVDYFFLNRKKTIDVAAVFRLRKYIVSNKIEFIHAHSTSFLIAVLVKISCPGLKIIWHDHYGNSEFLEKRKSLVLKISSFFFYRIIVVNQQLLQWGISNLLCKNITYLPNFTGFQEYEGEKTILNGTQGKRIVCLANLREQKNHFLLLEVALLLKNSHPDWSFHLVGQDFDDNYSKKIRESISSLQLENSVFMYGSKNDISNILSQSEIGILTSKSEGLPVALLEYGFHKLAVVMTAVGEIPKVIANKKNGILVYNSNSEDFYNGVCKIIEEPYFKESIGENLHKKIVDSYSESAILGRYFVILKK